MSNKYKKQLTADNSLCSQGVEQKEFLCSAGNNQWELPFWRATQQELVKLNPVTQQLLSSVCKQEISCTDVPKEMKNTKKNAHHNIVMAKTEIYRQAKSPSTGD